MATTLVDVPSRTASTARGRRAARGRRVGRGRRVARGARYRSVRSTVVRWTAAGLLVLAIATVAGFAGNGGRWFVVETPSMGTAAPVGTLVVTTRVEVSDLRVGDVIAFHPPSAATETYTHRVAVLRADGTVMTKGDLNGARDPWRLDGDDLVGRAAAVLPGVGWALRALPWLLGGLGALWLLTRSVRSPTHRAAARVLGSALAVVVVSVVIRPFTGFVLLTTTRTGGHAEALVVSTGLLPVRIAARGGGAHVDLVAGQVGRLDLRSVPAGTFDLSSTLHLPPCGWVLYAVLCTVPLLWCLVVGLPADDREGRR